MVKKALLDLSSGKCVTLSLDGKILKGAIRIGEIRNIREADTAKEIDVTILAGEVLVKKLDTPKNSVDYLGVVGIGR